MREFLRKIPLFADLPEDDLARLCSSVEEIKIGAAEILFREGMLGDKAYVIQEGELEIVKQTQGREVLLALRKSGEVIGELALLEEAPRMATVRARSDARLLGISKEQLDLLLISSSSAARLMLKAVVGKWRATQAQLQQSERLAQLGTLTAGVAHELNNPAAAVGRGASQMQTAIERLEDSQSRLARQQLTAEQRALIDNVTSRAWLDSRASQPLDALARSDLEMEIERWLEQKGIGSAWELAPRLVNLRLSEVDLEPLTQRFHDGQLDVVLSLMCAVHDIHSLLFEIQEGAGRISEIVGSLKSYAYLDQAPVQLVDVHKGIDNTLVILRHKLKQGIVVEKVFAESLPQIYGHGSELNQVWTNLIDNAADVLDGSGRIIIRTANHKDWIVVEVEDNGPGMPREVQERVFDAFFTTKPPGKGTGLGLNISYNVVVLKHRGEIKVDSRPGQTRFQVWLPVNFEQSMPGPASRGDNPAPGYS